MDFDIQSISWDDERRIKRAKVIAEQIAHTVNLKKYDNALEFGCGTGLVSFNLYDKLKAITCMDISQGMIDILNSKIQQNKVNNMVAYQHNINENRIIPQYDLIYTSMALHHIVDIGITLTSLYRLLKQDGSLCIVELNEDDGSFHKAEKDFNGYNGFDQKKLQKILEKIGFEAITSHTFYYDKKVIEEVNVDYSLFIMTGKKS